MATTANMNIPIDVPGSTAGAPSYQWAVDNETFKTIVDGHAHLGTPGSGLQIVTAALNINADLSFNNGGTPVNATNLRSVRLANNSSPLAVGTDLGCVYESGGNLYYNNSAGTQIRLTNGSAIDVSSAGGITGLPGTTAAVTYSSGLVTFTFTSNTGLSANLDAASVTVREPSVSNAKGITIKSPSGLAANYNLTLLTGLPATSGFPLCVDTAGQITTAAAGVQIPSLALASAATPASGNGTLYFDSLTGKVHAKVSGGGSYPVYMNVANGAATATITTTETIIAGGKTGGANAPVSNFQIPANCLVVGSIFRFKVWGTCTTTASSAAPTLFIRAGANGTTADANITSATVVNVSPFASAASNVPFHMDILGTVTVIGASAKIGFINAVTFNEVGTGGISQNQVRVNSLTNTFTFNSTVANYFSLTMGFGSAVTSAVVQQATAELI